MRRNSLLGLPTIVLALIAAPPTTAASITYNIQNYPSFQSGYTLSGTITTDGNVGTLTQADITSWSLSVSGGPNSFTAAGSGAGTGVESIGLVASTNQLTLADPGTQLFNVLSLSGNGGHVSWTEGGDAAGFSDNYYALNNVGNTTVWNTIPTDASFGGPPWIIAQAQITSVAEPGTRTMALVGLACLAVAQCSRRRHRAASRPLSSPPAHS
jgi:hypothetical protein